MLFDSTVRKELARSFGATLVVLLTIVLTMMLMRALGLAANGLVAPQDVVLMLGFLAVGNLPLILALSLFVAIVVSLGRMYRDSEMSIWFASGVDLQRFVRPVMRTGVPALVAIAVVVLVVWPWSNRQQNELRQRYEQRSDAMRATPGQFQSSADGRRVFFVEKEGAPGTGSRNVFIVTEQHDRESVASSQQGRLASLAGERFLMLDVGHMQQVDHKSGDFTHVEFEHYKVRAGESTASSGVNASNPKNLDTPDLLEVGGGPNLGEFVWRVGLVLAGANLMLIGIGMAATNPRRASNWSLLFALLAFIIYYNLLNLTQAWVSSGRMGAGVALLGLHGAACAFALALIWWRDHANVMHPLRALMFWRRGGTPSAGAAA